jgi:hypothetical protein
VEDEVDVCLDLHRLGAPARAQQDPDDQELSRGGSLTKGQARYRTRLNQHLLRKLHGLALFWLCKPECARVESAGLRNRRPAQLSPLSLSLSPSWGLLSGDSVVN